MPVIAEAVGEFGAAGGVINTTKVFFSPNPKEVQVAYVKVAEYLENLGPPLRMSRKIVREDVQERFDTESDPDGNAWHPLNQEYAMWKYNKGYDERILHMRGPLEAAATSQKQYEIDATNGNLFFSKTGMPVYWAIHQFGSEDYTPGMITKKQNRKLKLGLDEGEVGMLGKGGANVPPRPYLGVSDDAEEEILNAFDMWVYLGAKNVFVSGAGVLHHRVGGRIGPVVE